MALRGGEAGPPPLRTVTASNPDAIPGRIPAPNPVESGAHPPGSALPSILDHVVQRGGARGRDRDGGAVPVCSILNHAVQASGRSSGLGVELRDPLDDSDDASIQLREALGRNPVLLVARRTVSV